MREERRRYFRINETIGISYHVLDGEMESPDSTGNGIPNILELVSKQDQQIEKLLLEIADEHPKVAKLVTVFNQKLERVVNQLVLESHLVGRIAYHVKEANISACGIAFANDEKVSEGARLKLELTLYPSEKKIITNGIVVTCEAFGSDEWFWRIDFYGMSEQAQESLIQHVVQCQSLQLKKIRGN